MGGAFSASLPMEKFRAPKATLVRWDSRRRPAFRYAARQFLDSFPKPLLVTPEPVNTNWFAGAVITGASRTSVRSIFLLSRTFRAARDPIYPLGNARMSQCLGSKSVLLLGCLTVTGCLGSNDPNRLPTQPVSVQVNHKGTPVEGATVTFISSEEKPVPAVGRTNAAGVAKMKTYEEGDGAVLGKHKVIIIKSEISNASPEAADTESPDYLPPSPGGNPVPVLKDLIPRKYTSPATSGLTAEVTEGKPLELTFDLED